MASVPITSWQIDAETMETVPDFIFLGSKITADGDCSLKSKRCLLLGRKAMTNLDSILKSRDITLLTKVCMVKAMVFLVVVYGRESWTIRKAEWVKALSRVRLFVTPWTVAHQAPQPMGFSRQEYWSGWAISFSRGSSQLRDGTRVSLLVGRLFTIRVTRTAY